MVELVASLEASKFPLLILLVIVHGCFMVINLIFVIELNKVSRGSISSIFFVLGGGFSWVAIILWLLFIKKN
jgi:hypothetical protein